MSLARPNTIAEFDMENILGGPLQLVRCLKLVEAVLADTVEVLILSRLGLKYRN